MIQITADGKLVYDSRLDEYALMTLTTTTALNKGGTAVLTMPPGHPAYMDFIEYKTIVEVFRDGGHVFRGRVLYLEDGASNERTVTCEGELCFFHDAIHRPYLYQMAPGEIFQAVLEVYNQQVAEAQKQFKLGQVNVTDPNDYIRLESENAESTLDVLNKLLERCGGYFVFSTDEDGGRVISWLSELTGYSKQEITLENMLNFSRAGINTSIATAVLPYGAKDEETGQRLTVSSVNEGQDFIVDEEARQLRGFICRTVVWDDVTIPENLLLKAKQWLAENKMIVTSISLTAMDLSVMDKSVDSFQVGDSIQVRIPAYGVDDRFRLTEKTEDWLYPSGSQITLGKEVQSLTGADVAGDNAASSELQQVAESIKKDYEIGISNAVTESRTELESLINQTSEEIILEVSKIEKKQDELGEKQTTFEQTADGFRLSIQEIKESPADRVVTENGYTFNGDGLTIQKSDQDMKNLLNSDGMKVKRKDEEVLVADKDGVQALNLKARQYLIAGEHARFEDYADGRTACFWI